MIDPNITRIAGDMARAHARARAFKSRILRMKTALRAAYKALDSVAFMATEGDTDKIKAQILSALS